MATPVDQRQSLYPVRPPDIYDRFVMAENPDPAGDGSFAPRSTAQTDIRYLASMIRRAVHTSGTAQAVNGEIIPIALTSAAITIEAPAAAVAGTSFGIKILPGTPPSELCTVQDTANGHKFETLLTGPEEASAIVFVPGETVMWTLFERTPGTFVWLVSGSHFPYAGGAYRSEFWSIPADTNANLAGGPVPLTFLHGPLSTPVLFTESGGVLTAQRGIGLLVKFHLNPWITLASNNNSARLFCDPVTNSPIGYLPNMWSSQGAPRAESFPNTLTGDGYVEFNAGETIQLNSTLINMAGANSATFGSSASGDTWGGIIEFTL